MTQQFISEEKIYELALAEKKHHEERRDDINGHYISLFAAIIAVTPFINNLVDAVPGKYEGIVIRISLTILSLIGAVLAIIWSANLKRILLIVKYLDKIIIDLEKKHNMLFKTELLNQLKHEDAPDRITSYQLIMPRMFICIFISIIIYSLGWIIAF